MSVSAFLQRLSQVLNNVFLLGWWKAAESGVSENKRLPRGYTPQLGCPLPGGLDFWSLAFESRLFTELQRKHQEDFPPCSELWSFWFLCSHWGSSLAIQDY